MNVLQLIVSSINSVLPVKHGTILFKSFSGQYSDSPRALSEYIHNKYPQIHIIWVKSAENHDVFPEYVHVIDINSLQFNKYEWRANVIIDNISSVRSDWISPDEKILKKMILKYYTRKRKKQLSISTWHGIPLKRIGMDNISFRKDCFLSTNCNYVLAGNKHSQNCLKSALGNAIPIIMSGIPRNDRLINNTDDINKIKKYLGIPIDKKVVLYAPTFRNDIYSSGVNQMKEMDFNFLTRLLHEKFGGDWCFVFRTHMHVSNEIRKMGLLKNYKNVVIDGNVHDDMADYLLCADVLITDYSSSMFDFIYTGKPCYLYTPDIVDYNNKERGFYFEINQLPFPYADSLSNLYKIIEQFNYEEYIMKCDEFYTSIGDIEEGNATSRVADEIISFIRGNKIISDFMSDRR